MPEKQDTRRKNEIGMNLGNKILPPLIYIYSCKVVYWFSCHYLAQLGLQHLVYQTAAD